jgi:hypothetical protein
MQTLVLVSALEQLFATLRQLGHLFSNDFWQVIFRGVLFPLFNGVRYAEDIKEVCECERDESQASHSSIAQLHCTALQCNVMHLL